MENIPLSGMKDLTPIFSAGSSLKLIPQSGIEACYKPAPAQYYVP